MSPRLMEEKRSKEYQELKEKYMNFDFAGLMQRLLMVSHSVMSLRDVWMYAYNLGLIR